MTCGVCGRPSAAGQCDEGYVVYLSGDYPCPFNPDKDWLDVRNAKVLPPLVAKRAAIPPPPESADGLEDLL